MSIVRCSTLIFSLLCLCCLLPFTARATNIDMGEYEALPAGTEAFLLYYKGSQTNSLYANNNKVLGDARVQVNAAVFRYVRYQMVGKYLVAGPQFILPYGEYTGSENLDNLGSTRGLGDLLIPVPVFLVNNPNERRTLVINPIIQVPIGSYDHNSTLNLGENRWKLEVQLGGTTAIAEKWNLELVTGVEFFEDNTDYGPSSVTLEQEARYKSQLYFNYYASPTTRFALGANYVTGGKTTINGIDQDNRLSTTRYIVNAAKTITPKDQLLISLSRDASVRNGLREEGRVVLRWLHFL